MGRFPSCAKFGFGPALALGLFAAVPALAVVGGAADPAGGRGAVMLISPRGGVCTGVLIAPDVALTAAHCVAGGAPMVRFPGGQARAAAVAAHPGFVPDAIRKRVRSIDLGLVRLPQAVAGAPLAALAPTGPADGATIRAAGFGLTATGAAGTEGAYRAVDMRVAEPHGRSKILVWARPAGSGASGICQGDLGGPLRIGGGSDGPVFAVSTWTVGACGGEAQGVLVGPQRTWIDRVLAGWGASAVWRR